MYASFTYIRRCKALNVRYFQFANIIAVIDGIQLQKIVVSN